MSLLQPIQEILSKIEGKNAEYKKEVISDYWVCLVSRETSLLGRKEVLTGKAKFGILGDGKELPQVAMARAFQKGDFRSGYYRDQTFMMALGLCSVQDYFAQLYADTQNDPFSGGRQMNAHFSTALIDREGDWLKATERYNVSSDVSSTGGQMARALGLALASKHYRQDKALSKNDTFSNHGNEVSFVTIGDASTSEGVFWETINAASVLQVPLAVCVWDDGYGISVPIALQTTKQSISKALAGFEYDKNHGGLHIHKVKAWDYPKLVNVFHEGIEEIRKKHIPALFHIQEVTQPQGHSTSGSHERYKSKERMNWEQDMDCIKVFGEWMLKHEIIHEEIQEELKSLAKQYVKDEKQLAWNNFIAPVQIKKQELLTIYNQLNIDEINNIKEQKEISWHELLSSARKINTKLRINNTNSPELLSWIQKENEWATTAYSKHLYAEDNKSIHHVKNIEALIPTDAQEINGFQILNNFFDILLDSKPEVVAFGEDVGQIGDVNQGFAGLQEKFGTLRVFDTGIREWTIIGQAIGMAMRGLRPIAEIQYLDYIVYALSALMDDLATIRYRSNGIQKSPVIIRTRGHRLEGIWHSGSPIGMLLHSLRGIHICVPRNMTQAAGMYQTLLQGDDPGLVIECLNAYRLKEKLPSNLNNFTVPLGHCEILQEGNDLTLVSYGSCIRIAEEAIIQLRNYNVHIELIDVQTLLPFDILHMISASLQKTNKLLILDEDVPGGASAFILQQIVEEQQGIQFLDSAPVTITARAHRPPYGSDGDYVSKPSVEDVVEKCLEIMHEYDPGRY